MKLTKDRNAQLIILAGIVLLTLLALLSRTNWLESVEHLSLDLRFVLRGAKPFTSPVALIGVDESSIDTLGRWPWPRSKHATLLRLLEYAPFRPATISYDILFEDPDTDLPASDAALVERARALGDDLILAYFFEKGVASEAEFYPEKEKTLEAFAINATGKVPGKLEEATKVSLPYDPLIRESALAFVNSPIDRDGRTRRMRLLQKYKGRVYPSITLLSVLNLLEADLRDVALEENAIIIKKAGHKNRVIPVSSAGDMLINYVGSVQNIPRFSFIELLKEGELWMGRNEPPVKLKSLKGRIVVVGTTALGLEDRRVTPFHRFEPATSIQAQAIATIVENNFLREFPRAYSLFIFLSMGLVIILYASSQKAVRALLVTSVIVSAYLLGAYIAFLNNYWIEIANPIINITILFVIIVSFRYVLTSEELKRTHLQLLHAEKMASLGGLASEIAHEYRNFLHIISSAADVLTIPNLDKAQYERYTQTIQTAVKKANQITEGLLTFARRNKPQKKRAT